MGKKKFNNQTDMKIAVIGDEDTVTGMVLAGIGHVDGQGKKNFLIVDSKTVQKDIEEKFHELTARKDTAMVLITQGCADQIRNTVDDYGASGQVIPTILEIPSKEQPYDPRKDAIMHLLHVEQRIFLPRCTPAPTSCSCRRLRGHRRRHRTARHIAPLRRRGVSNHAAHKRRATRYDSHPDGQHDRRRVSRPTIGAG